VTFDKVLNGQSPSYDGSHDSNEDEEADAADASSVKTSPTRKLWSATLSARDMHRAKQPPAPARSANLIQSEPFVDIDFGAYSATLNHVPPTHSVPVHGDDADDPSMLFTYGRRSADDSRELTSNHITANDANDNPNEHLFTPEQLDKYKQARVQSEHERQLLAERTFQVGADFEPHKNRTVNAICECMHTYAAKVMEYSAECMDYFDERYTQSCGRHTWQTRYMYDKESGRCRKWMVMGAICLTHAAGMFWYDGCRGQSTNIFTDLASCQWLCEGTQPTPETSEYTSVTCLSHSFYADRKLLGQIRHGLPRRLPWREL
jgi:hypothetical protein